EITVAAKMVIPLDVTALDSAIAQATTRSQMTDLFTAKTLAVLNQKLAAAQSLLYELQVQGTATTHTQADVDTATAALNAAIKGLKISHSKGSSVDYSALARAINDGQAKLGRSADYTPESTAVLQTAVDQGQTILAQVSDPTLKQATVDNATAAIKKAIAGLQLATGPEIRGVSVSNGATVKGDKTFTVTLGGKAKDVSYTYIELNQGASHVWVTDNTKAQGSTNHGLKPTLVVDTRTIPNGSYSLKIDAVGTNGKTTEKTVSFTVKNK
ncbi:MAG TPA: hypothetical protein VHD87_10400, partial [Acidimicrobiales bacterium]|nr:hypothetical protein [Acidimicrobiales bacterium]